MDKGGPSRRSSSPPLLCGPIASHQLCPRHPLPPLHAAGRGRERLQASAVLRQQHRGPAEPAEGDAGSQRVQHRVLLLRHGVRQRAAALHGDLPHGVGHHQPLRHDQAHGGDHPDGRAAGRPRHGRGAAAVLQPRGSAHLRVHGRGPRGHPQQPHALHPARGVRPPAAAHSVRAGLEHPRR